jgi:hypothetical protein
MKTIDKIMASLDKEKDDSPVKVKVLHKGKKIALPKS